MLLVLLLLVVLLLVGHTGRLPALGCTQTALPLRGRATDCLMLWAHACLTHPLNPHPSTG